MKKLIWQVRYILWFFEEFGYKSWNYRFAKDTLAWRKANYQKYWESNPEYVAKKDSDMWIEDFL